MQMPEAPPEKVLTPAEMERQERAWRLKMMFGTMNLSGIKPPKSKRHLLFTTGCPNAHHVTWGAIFYLEWLRDRTQPA